MYVPGIPNHIMEKVSNPANSKQKQRKRKEHCRIPCVESEAHDAD